MKIKTRLGWLAMMAALGLGCVSGLAAANITFTGQEAIGEDWNMGNYWSDGNPASISAAANPTQGYELLPGSIMRSVNNSAACIFPGAFLQVDGNGTYINNPNPWAPVAEIRFKSVDMGTVYFTNLIMKGGQCINGIDGTVVIQGKLTVLSNMTFYGNILTDIPSDRGFQIDAQLVGTGTITYYHDGDSITNGVFNTNFVRDLNITGTSNTFSGKWNVAFGPVLGSGIGSLGTNDITVASQGILETLYDVNNPTGNLFLNGKMYLHQNDTFNTLVINGTPLGAGKYTFAQLTAAFPKNFPPTWNPIHGSRQTSGSGSIKVLTARVVRVTNNSGPPSAAVSVAIELLAQGNENALGLSLSFDPTTLIYSQTTNGNGGGVSLIVNANQVSSGRLGMQVGLGAGRTFQSGTQQVAVITFQIAGNTTADTTAINFGDQPIVREVGDATANSLPASWWPGTVTISNTPVKVDIYSGFVGSGGGAPYSRFVGSFNSPRIQFGSDTGDNWHPLGQKGFGADLTGFLSVPNSGNYTFSLRSDDGSLLFIDGGLAMDNGNPHSPATVSQMLFLTQGVHPFEVQYFEDGTGQSALNFHLPAGVSYAQGIAITQSIAVIPPRSLSVSVGASATFRLASTGVTPSIIQWLFNEQSLAGATNATLLLTNVTVSQTGSYGVALAIGGSIQFFGPWTLNVDPTFTKITRGVVVGNIGIGDSVGCAWGDYDNDGFLDLVVANAAGQNEFLYHNNGNGTFARVTTGPLVNSASDSVGVAWADFDNDGTLDLFISNWSNQANFLFRNNGDGTFARILNGSIAQDQGLSAGCVWGDYDNDGNLDLFVATYGQTNNFLYRGHGDGTFERITNGIVATGKLANSIQGSWGDYNDDGKLDLFVVNEGGNSALYKNEGGGQFTRITSGILVNDGYGTAAAWADYDNDGNLDLVVTTATAARLYHNNGQGGFTKLLLPAPGPQTIYGCAWGDYDNDGFLDLLLTDREGGNNVLYHNNGDGTFSRVTTGSIVNDGGHSWSAAWGDYDNDGFLDLFVSNRDSFPNFLYHNNGNSNHWLEVKLVGTRSNRSGIGAKVRLKAVIGGRSFWQRRDVGSGGSYGQNELNAHFGLGDASTVDTLRIEWPSGIVQELHNLSPNQFLTITEPPAASLELQMISGQPALTIQGLAGSTYRIEYSPNLISPNWTTLLNLTLPFSPFTFFDAGAVNAASRFYRAVIP